MTEPSPGIDPAEQDWLDDERDAFLALENGRYDEAAEIWERLLADARAVAFFRESDDGDAVVKEIAGSLVDAHRGAGAEDKALAVAAAWGVPPTAETGD